MRLTTHQIHPRMEDAIEQAITFLRNDLALGADVAEAATARTTAMWSARSCTVFRYDTPYR
jgi:hypothetical protein